MYLGGRLFFFLFSLSRVLAYVAYSAEFIVEDLSMVLLWLISKLDKDSDFGKWLSDVFKW